MKPRFELPAKKFKNGGAWPDGVVKFLFQVESDYPFSKDTQWEWKCDKDNDIQGVAFSMDNFNETIFVGFSSLNMDFNTYPNDCFKVKGTFRNDASVTVRAKREGLEIKHTIYMSELLAANNDTHALALNDSVVTVTDTEDGEVPVTPPPVMPPPNKPPVIVGEEKKWYNKVIDYFKIVTGKAVLITLGVVLVVGFILGLVVG